MLQPVIDDQLHSAHAEALLAQFTAVTIEVLEQYGYFDKQRASDIANDLLFRICAILDGSSHPGTLNGDEIAPFVGFYLNHSTLTPLIPENGSAMHAFVSAAVERHYSEKSAAG